MYQSLLAAEHPTIGTVQLFGQTIWLGWLMVTVMSLIVIGPLFYGHAKSKLAPTLHNKLLFADADMAKADWQTNAATIVGVLGVGIGLWWLDGAAAVFISLGIVWDGYKNIKAAVLDLIDQRARRYNEKGPHPIALDILRELEATPWVADAGVRIRDEGQVFHVEAFVVPKRHRVKTDQIRDLHDAIIDLSWKIQDLVVAVTDKVPDYADQGEDYEAQSAS